MRLIAIAVTVLFFSCFPKASFSSEADWGWYHISVGLTFKPTPPTFRWGHARVTRNRDEILIELFSGDIIFDGQTEELDSTIKGKIRSNQIRGAMHTINTDVKPFLIIGKLLKEVIDECALDQIDLSVPFNAEKIVLYRYSNCRELINKKSSSR